MSGDPQEAAKTMEFTVCEPAFPLPLFETLLKEIQYYWVVKEMYLVLSGNSAVSTRFGSR